METTKMNHEEIIDIIDLDLGYEPDHGINTHIEADRTLAAIQHIDAQMDRENQRKKEAIEFYEKRIQQKRKAREFLESKLENYLETLRQGGMDAKASTPSGTAYIQKKKKPIWAPENTLVEYAKKYAPDTVKVTEKVDKTKLKKSLGKETSGILDYQETESLVIRKPDKKEAQQQVDEHSFEEPLF